MTAASASACRANAQNPPRHQPAVANAPPIRGPVSAETPQTPEITASSCGQRSGANSWVSPTCASATIQPPPQPCSSRPSSISAMSGASALSAQPAA